MMLEARGSKDLCERLNAQHSASLVAKHVGEEGEMKGKHNNIHNEELYIGAIGQEVGKVGYLASSSSTHSAATILSHCTHVLRNDKGLPDVFFDQLKLVSGPYSQQNKQASHASHDLHFRSHEAR